MAGQPVPVAAPRLRRPRAALDGEEERCEICTAPIPDDHRHVVDLDRHSLLCACRGCHLLFAPDGAGGRRFRAVPDRYEEVAPPSLAEIPVGVVFFYVSSPLGRVVALYPGPAGATESLLPLDAQADFDMLTPDVEAVLVGAGSAYVVPIDACYELVGLLRRPDADIGDVLDSFFGRVKAKAR